MTAINDLLELAHHGTDTVVAMMHITSGCPRLGRDELSLRLHLPNQHDMRLLHSSLWHFPALCRPTREIFRLPSGRARGCRQDRAVEEQQSLVQSSISGSRLPKLRVGVDGTRAIRPLALSAGRRLDLPLPTFGLSVREAFENLCHGAALSCISLPSIVLLL